MGVELMVASAVLGVAGGVADYNQAKSDARAVERETALNVAERKKLTEQQLGNQTMTFLKSGVNLEGSADAVLEETKKIGSEDVAAMQLFGRNKAKNIKRQGRAGLFNSLTGGITNIVGAL